LDFRWEQRLSLQSNGAAVSAKLTERVYLNIIPTAKDPHPPFNRGRKYNSNCRTRNSLRLSCLGSISGSILSLASCFDRRHASSLAPPLFLLPRYRPLGGRKTSRHPLRFLHCWRDRKSHWLSFRPAVVVRAFAILWSADRKGLDAEGCSNLQSDHVVRGSYIFRCDSYAKRVLRS
jgi:hypothetical protein